MDTVHVFVSTGRIVGRGMLRVIYHPPAFVGGVAVAGWWKVSEER